PPALFHKARVTEGARGALHPDVRAAVLSDKAKAVAVVVNAVDDELAGAEQVRARWTLDAVRPLAALLQAARDDGRLVILAGDHGHVLHCDHADYRKAPAAGERWRPADPPAGVSACRLTAPGWWEVPPAAPAAPPPVAPAVEPRRPAVGSLFDVVPADQPAPTGGPAAPAPADRSWIDRLFASEVFQSQ